MCIYGHLRGESILLDPLIAPQLSDRRRRPQDFPLQYEAKWFDPSMDYLEYMGERPLTTS
jgi:hypothetical protein